MNLSKDCKELLDEANEAYVYGDYKKAIRLYQAIEHHEIGHVFYRLGVMHRNGNHCEKNPERATGYFHKALQSLPRLAELGDPEAECDLGYMYLEGCGLEKSHAMALKFFGLSAAKGYSRAQSNMGYMHLNGVGCEKNYNLAFEYYSKAAIQKCPNALASLAFMYTVGQGVEIDKDLALKYHKMAAETGDADSLTSLAYQYAHGDLERDYPKALEYYLMAAERNHPVALSNLGYMHHHGEGVERNHEKALEYYEKAAKIGAPYAQVQLAHFHFFAEKKDLKKAFHYYSMAANQQDAKGMYYLANMYENGHSVPQNFELAAKYYQSSALKKDAEAIKFMSKLCRSVFRTNFRQIAIENLGRTWPKSHSLLHPECKEKVTFLFLVFQSPELNLLRELGQEIIMWVVRFWPEHHFQHLPEKENEKQKES